MVTPTTELPLAPCPPLRYPQRLVLLLTLPKGPDKVANWTAACFTSRTAAPVAEDKPNLLLATRRARAGVADGRASLLQGGFLPEDTPNSTAHRSAISLFSSGLHLMLEPSPKEATPGHRGADLVDSFDAGLIELGLGTGLAPSGTGAGCILWMSVCGACLARDTDDHLCHRTKPSHFCPCRHVLCATRRATYVTPSPHRVCVLCALSCIQWLAKCSDQFPSLNLVYPPCLPVQDASNGLRHDLMR
ncbi:hypothetical protein V8C34DRAFT_293144 [Trichoderma compactum]